MRGVPALLALPLLLAAVAGCDTRAPSASNLREWSAADHDRFEENQRMMSGQQPGSAPSGATSQEQVIDVAWRAKCATCHGPIGHGDGPTGPMVKAPDLTREDWQAKVSDGEIAATIRSGRGKMPAFTDLPDSTIQGLVARIRATRGQ